MDHEKSDDGLPLAILPELILPERSLEGAIRNAIAVYGSDAVREMAARLTKPSLGRSKIKDWPELRDVIEADAKDWLDGGDPISTRSNYSIAREYAEKNPGQSPISTHKRIERKLAKKPYDRAWFMLTSAMLMSRDNYPFATHLKALEALAAMDPHRAWQTSLRLARTAVAEYEVKKGQPPPAELTMKDVEDGGRNALASSLLSQVRSRGVFPGLSSRTGKTRD